MSKKNPCFPDFKMILKKGTKETLTISHELLVLDTRDLPSAVFMVDSQFFLCVVTGNLFILVHQSFPHTNSLLA